MRQQILQCDETELMYYLNKSWDIIAQCPNPYPQPRMYFYIRRYLEELPTQEELETIRKEAKEALEFSRTQIFY